MVVTVALAGGSPVATATEKLSTKQFLKEANAICNAAFSAVEANFEDQGAGFGENEAPSPTQSKEGVSVLVELLDGAAADIEAPRGTAALETRVGTFLDRVRSVTAEFESDPQAAFARELRGYPFAKTDKLAQKIGLKECVQRG